MQNRILTIKPTGIERNSATSGALLSCPAGMHSQVLSWIAAGGNATPTTIQLLDTFFCGLDKDGITYGSSGKIKRLNLFCGKLLADCLRPQIVTLGDSTDSNSSTTPFVESDYAENMGLYRNVANDLNQKILNTGVVDSSLSGTNSCFGYYLRQNNTSDYGGYSNNGWMVALNRIIGNLSDSKQSEWQSSYGAYSESSGGRLGLYVFTHEAGGTQRLYRNGSQDNTVSATAYAGGGATTWGIFGNTIGYNTTKGILGGYFMGEYLTSTEQSNFYKRWQAFQTALNRQV